MTPYQCWFYITRLSQPSFKVIHADTDAEARRLVSLILRDLPEIERVEVWRNNDFAFRLNQHQVHLEMYCARSARRMGAASTRFGPCRRGEHF